MGLLHLINHTIYSQVKSFIDQLIDTFWGFQHVNLHVLSDNHWATHFLLLCYEKLLYIRTIYGLNLFKNKMTHHNWTSIQNKKILNISLF